MLRVRSITRNTLLALGCALLLALPSVPASADTIDVSLNLLYANPQSPLSGGNWELVAKTDGFGLAALKVLLTNIATAQSTAPRGVVNSSITPDPAGLAIFTNNFNPLGFNEINIVQAPLAPGERQPGEEQTVFYGIGTLVNGAPNYPGKPPGSNSIGPAFTSLTGVPPLSLPWATGDVFSNPDWSTAAKLASGTFAPGFTPGFYQDAIHVSHGNTFTSLGTSTDVGDLSPQDVVPTIIVRTNLMFSPSTGDYNHNGVVDAADYVVWRDTLGSTTLLDADGNGNNVIDDGDYTVWRMKFGTIPGAGAALGAAAVPEPAAGAILIIGTLLAQVRRRRPTTACGLAPRARPARSVAPTTPSDPKSSQPDTPVHARPTHFLPVLGPFLPITKFP